MNSSSLIKVGLIQFESRVGEYDRNLERALQMIDVCVQQHCHLVCLPEAFATTLDLRDCQKVAEEIPGKTTEILSQKARDSHIHLVFGMLEKQGDNVYSTSVLINHEGVTVGSYRKIHIFRLEKKFIHEGEIDALDVVETPIGRSGMILGYDINFPEVCRILFRKKAEIIICPSQIPNTYSQPTQLLARARAAENNCYFLFVSSVGENTLARLTFMGHSLIVRNPIGLDPYGPDYIREKEIIAQAGTEETIIYGTLNMKKIRREQEENPHYEDARMC